MKFLLTNQETERLKFRKLNDNDFEEWQELFEDEEVTRLLGMHEFKTPRERCEKWFEWTFHRYKNDLGGQNILISKINNQIVGQCGLLVREVENKFEIEIAYSILPKFRQNGFATESAMKCRDFAFENNFHNRLISIINAENLNSKNVALKNGLNYSHEIIYNDQKMDLYTIEIKDWQLNTTK
ncbi:GNAT family N-acetyltransferase [Chryseobacterium sp. SNU WT5]|uniref:GNAT family N-acetyltransferase n=1 Tax=Chryseobacterium sp. SNU WT5 TaxID=2594269 RepID=UPI00117DCD9C|nr:GNAT family N-acetyltransferase [Chryseobacterium sp. SNU WT5]QDP85511.1 GNAT family N-acetyltransferase [Chryseobacterium sp. SNU WT5]